jgi:XTP/dITP diphosphohydrolase
MTLRVVLASNNAKTLGELQQLFGSLPVQLLAQGQLGVAEADEPHHTFIENALTKARHAARASGLPAIADDSGLCVDVLGGAPGVHSAHYAEAPQVDGDREALRRAQDAANNALLLRAMQGRDDRRVHFVCTLVALRHADDPQPLVASGRWAAELLHEARGQGGFGYDPLVYVPVLGATVAELAAEVKNRHSHRALAVQALLPQLREFWRL